MIVLSLLALSGIGCSSISHDKPSDPIATWPDLTSAIDALFADYDKPFHPGGMTAVIYEGELIHLKGYGAANREFNVPWTADTRYRIASMSKSFLAHALLILQDRGLLHLDSLVRKYLSELPDYGVPLTLRHLLQMSSGLWQDEHMMIFAGTVGIDSMDTMYELSLRQRKLDFTPGSYYRSTDVNPRILARIIASVTGKPFHEAMADILFRPLGLTSTSAPLDFSEVFDRQATTYTIMPDRTWPPNHIRVWIPLTGAGAIITSMNDLISWLGQVTKKGVDGWSFFDRMTAPMTMSNGDPAVYRLGLYRISHRGLDGWGHGGHTGTQYVHFPEIDLTIALFTNYLGGINSTEILRGMIDAFLKAAGNPHTFYLSSDNPEKDHRFLTPPAPIPEDEVAALVGTYVERGSGYTLALSTGNGHDLRSALLRGGGGAYLIRPRKGSYTSDVNAPVQQIRIEVEACEHCDRPSLLVLNADWVEPRRFAPASTLDLADVPVEDYLGRYFSDELDAFHSVRQEDETLLLRMGPGLHGMQRFALTPLGGDVFEGRAEGFGEIATHYVAVKFERDSAGKVGVMRVSAEWVRNLRLRRVGQGGER